MPLSPGIFNRLFKQQDRNPCEGLHYYIDNTNDDKNISPYRGPANGLSECCSPRSVDRGRRLYDLQRFRERSVRFRAEQRVVSLSGPSRTLVIGKFCSIACGAKFLFNCANHSLRSLSTYTFLLFYEEWGLDRADVASAWDDKGDIVIGNDVWIGFEAVILSGVHIGDGAIIGTRAVVTKDVPAYTIVGGVPAREIRKRFDADTVERLQRLRWWDWPVDKIRENIPHITNGEPDACCPSDIRRYL